MRTFDYRKTVLQALDYLGYLKLVYWPLDHHQGLKMTNW